MLMWFRQFYSRVRDFFALTFVMMAMLVPRIMKAQESDLPKAPQPAASSGFRNFFERLGDAYKEDWNPSPAASSAPSPQRRGYPAPLDSVPFPSGDYSVGGTPVIGAPDTQTYPLMQAINQNRGRIKIYGWLNGGFNVSTPIKAMAPTRRLPTIQIPTV